MLGTQLFVLCREVGVCRRKVRFVLFQSVLYRRPRAVSMFMTPASKYMYGLNFKVVLYKSEEMGGGGGS